MIDGAKPVVVCVDSSPDVAELLRDVFVGEGFRAAPFHSTLAQGSETVIAFLNGLQPQACVYTVSFPYQENWAEFERVRRAVPDIAWVATTTNKSALGEMVGPTDAIEIAGKTSDLEMVIAAVRQALQAG